MKLALIPPLCYPYQFGHDNYQLLLPQLWDRVEHRQAYTEATALNHRRGGFTILDNGAAEDQMHDWDDLLKLARRFYVNEVVLPDVLGDAQGTKAAVAKVLEDTWHPTNYFGLMGVVQGQTMQECYNLIDYYCGLQGRTLTSIGVPRCLINTLDVQAARVHLCEYIRSRSLHIDIHLLGTNPDYIFELKYFGRDFRALHVRGVDTSAPFVYAWDHQWIGSGGLARRPDNYFDKAPEAFSKKLVQQNFDTMAGWVHG